MAWQMPTVKDGRGNSSTMAVFIIPAALLVMGKFALSGLFGIPVMSGLEFAGAFGAVLGLWKWREDKEKDRIDDPGIDYGTEEQK